MAAVREVFPEEVAREPIPEAPIIKRLTYLTSTKDKENRLGRGLTDQIQRQGRMRKPNESWSSEEFSQAEA